MAGDGRPSTTFLGATSEVVDGRPSPAMTGESRSFRRLVLLIDTAVREGSPMLDRSIKRLSKKARRGMRGFPLGTVAFYGPDDRRATKVVAGVKVSEDADVEVRKWFVETGDARANPVVAAELLAHFETNGVKSVAMIDGIFGCPHEEDVDYEGEYCPVCTFWIGRDRYTGKLER
jgi:hypothetical protein